MMENEEEIQKVRQEFTELLKKIQSDLNTFKAKYDKNFIGYIITGYLQVSENTHITPLAYAGTNRALYEMLNTIIEDPSIEPFTKCINRPHTYLNLN